MSKKEEAPKPELLGCDLATKDGESSVYVYGYHILGMTFITEIKKVTFDQYAKQ